MGLRFIVGREQGSDVMEMAVMYSSTTGYTFGRVFYGSNDGAMDALEVGQRFLDWCEKEHGVREGDVRSVSPQEIARLQNEFDVIMTQAHG